MQPFSVHVKEKKCIMLHLLNFLKVMEVHAQNKPGIISIKLNKH